MEISAHSHIKEIQLFLASFENPESESTLYLWKSFAKHKVLNSLAEYRKESKQSIQFIKDTDNAITGNDFNSLFTWELAEHRVIIDKINYIFKNKNKMSEFETITRSTTVISDVMNLIENIDFTSPNSICFNPKLLNIGKHTHRIIELFNDDEEKDILNCTVQSVRERVPKSEIKDFNTFASLKMLATLNDYSKIIAKQNLSLEANLTQENQEKT